MRKVTQESLVDCAEILSWMIVDIDMAVLKLALSLCFSEMMLIFRTATDVM